MSRLLKTFATKSWTLRAFACFASLLFVTSAEASQFAYPMSGHISDTYWAKRWYGTHGGLDMAGNWQEPIHTARQGKVSFAGWSNDGSGWLVIIDHENGYQTYYEHMAKRPLVKWGQEVTPDTQLGVQGATGNANGAHLHFEIRKDGLTIPQPERLNVEFSRGGELQLKVNGLSDVQQFMREKAARELREREEKDRIERERREREERERLEREARERREREERERIERERREQQERERVAREAAERKAREEAERLERERIAREEAERKTREERETRRRDTRLHIEDRETAIRNEVAKLESTIAAIQDGRHRTVFGNIIAFLSGTIGRESTQLMLLRASIGKLENEAESLATLNASLEQDPNFDPISMKVPGIFGLPIDLRPSAGKDLSPALRGVSGTNSR